MLIKKCLLISVCAVLLLIRSTGSVTRSGSCDDLVTHREPTLEDYVESMNRKIREDCCGREKEIPLEHAFLINIPYVYNFQELQKKYSGALMCEINETKYYYPKFVLEREDTDYPVTENTRYKITPLAKDANGVYTGIRVIAYENEMDAKISEINKRVKRYAVSYFTKEQMNEVVTKYQKFQSEYSGKFLCVNAFNNKEIYCPNFTYEFKTASAERREWNLDAMNIRWAALVKEPNDDGIYPGIEIWPMKIAMDNGVHTTTRDLVGLSKEFKNDGVGAVPHAAAKTLELFIPNIPVDIY